MKSSSLLAAGMAVVFSLFASATVNAGLLEDHFGVNLQLLDPNPYSWSGNPFDLTSFRPTKNTDTVDFYVEDWYGKWYPTGWSHETLRYDAPENFDPNDPNTYANGYPSGGEPYDVEALYFDNDADNLYLAIVTSFDPPPGHIENGRGYNNLLIFTGDIAMDFGIQSPYADGFRYDFGINLNHEQRQADGSAKPGGSTIGSDVYRTSNSDWYVPKQAGVVNSKKLTNFDPVYSGLTSLGDATVSYRDMGLYENNYDTYVIEATIPRSFFESYLPKGFYDGMPIRVQWGGSCKNDMGEVSATLDATFNNPPPVTPELPPGLLLLLTSLPVALTRLRRKAKK